MSSLKPMLFLFLMVLILAFSGCITNSQKTNLTESESLGETVSFQDIAPYKNLPAGFVLSSGSQTFDDGLSADIYTAKYTHSDNLSGAYIHFFKFKDSKIAESRFNDVVSLFMDGFKEAHGNNSYFGDKNEINFNNHQAIEFTVLAPDVMRVVQVYAWKNGSIIYIVEGDHLSDKNAILELAKATQR